VTVADVLAGRTAWWLQCADVLAGLAELPDESVNCCITSPPYWSLRDYGTASWIGGDPGCPHKKNGGRPHVDPTSTLKSPHANTNHAQEGYRDVCRRCGAVRVDQQMGLEPTPDAYVARLVAVFREVRRVMRPEAVAFVNLGDGYRDKQLLGMPWQVAFALQQDGWWLRSAITLCKRAPLPESVTDRPTSATEMLFLLTKAPRYWYDADAVREPHGEPTTGLNPHGGQGAHYKSAVLGLSASHPTGVDGHLGFHPAGRNQRNWWEISPEPYPDAHFATFGTEIPRRTILAGCPMSVCPQCGAPWTRLVEKSGGTIGTSWHNHVDDLGRGQRGGDDGHNAASAGWKTYRVETLGYSPGCTHDLEPVPGVVLDPFAGSGTSLLVALRLGRRALGIELSPAYCELARARIVGDAPLFNTPDLDAPPVPVPAPTTTNKQDALGKTTYTGFNARWAARTAPDQQPAPAPDSRQAPLWAAPEAAG
jgi:site-specific DNA-methyltransferase (cytosine-N4-specific)